MRFAIQYLKETTNEYSVCSSREVDCENLADARAEAWRSMFSTLRLGATGFQIRDAHSFVVAIEQYDDQLESATVH